MPAYKEKRAKAEAEAGYKSTMEYAQEQLKLGAEPGVAVAALESDKQAHVKVYLAEKMHRRLLKMRKEDVANAFKAKCQQLYLWSTYFEGE